MALGIQLAIGALVGIIALALYFITTLVLFLDLFLHGRKTGRIRRRKELDLLEIWGIIKGVTRLRGSTGLGMEEIRKGSGTGGLEAAEAAAGGGLGAGIVAGISLAVGMRMVVGKRVMRPLRPKTPSQDSSPRLRLSNSSEKTRPESEKR